MNNQLTQTQQNRNALAQTLESEKEYVLTVITADKVDEFKNNYLELAQNTYLISKIPLIEILRTAVNATALGVNVNPIYKECYILPFQTKTGSVASIVLEQNGHKNMAFQSGFFLEVDNIWAINGKDKKESTMSYSELALLKTTDIEFVKQHLLGWEIKLKDISDEKIKIPIQIKFVGLEFVLEATKQLQSPKYSIQAWIHKAVRRAMRDMFIPRHRKSMHIEKIDAWNDENENEKRDFQEVHTEAVNLDEEIYLAIEADIEESVTLKDIQLFYTNANDEDKVLIQTVMSENPNWKEYDENGLAEVMKKLKDL